MECLICNKKIKHINGFGIHIKRIHNINIREYYDRYFRNYSRDEGFCLECGKETNFHGSTRGYLSFCSIKCSRNSKIVKNKQKQTCLEKYGVENTFQSDKIKEKIKNTCLEKYGVEHIRYSEEFKEKYKQTCLEKYGVENPVQSEEIKEKIKNTCLEKYGVEYSSQSKEVRCKKKIRGLIGVKNNKPLFKFYDSKINWCEETRDTKEGYLEVRCKKCNKWFIPKIIDLKNRLQHLNGNYSSENNLYCSDECKNSCSIFGKRLYQEGQNPNSERPWRSEWSREVKRIANYECEICGSRKSLEAHHIEPVKLRPDLQADIDNGICLCRNCHSKYGHKDECSTGNLAKRIC